MHARLPDVTGSLTTIVAGILLASLSLSTFGATPTLLAFAAVFLLATAVQRALTHHR
jgi:hypothetical protein